MTKMNPADPLQYAAALRRQRAAQPGASRSGAAAAASANPATAVQVPDTIAQRVAACVACHGQEGRSAPDAYYPRIAGKPAGYLYNQLANFRAGRRWYRSTCPRCRTR